jgi:hypothetical protein
MSLRAMPIPDTEPAPDSAPYRVDVRGSRMLPSMRQPTLALALVIPPREPQYLIHPDAAGGPDDLRGVPFGQFGQFGPRPTSTGELPEPQAWAGRMVQAVLEVLAGVRPVAQLVRWASLPVYTALQRRCTLAASRAARANRANRPHQVSQSGRPEAGRRAIVRSVHICQPADGVVEASAVVVAGGRVQAVALRLEGLDGRWQMTALELG